MDESYLMPKAPGSEALSGAINGDYVLTLRATRLAIGSRYARIMDVNKRAPHSPSYSARSGSRRPPACSRSSRRCRR
jgi:cation transport ATPase